MSDLDLSAFRFTAVADWIQVRVVTKAPTHPWVLWRQHDWASWVQSENPQPSGTATSFVITVQTPKNWAELKRHLDSLEAVRPLTSKPELTAIEVAFDAFSKDQDRSLLESMAVRLFRTTTKPVSDNRRAAGRSKHLAQGIPNHAAVRRVLGEGLPILVGNVKDDLMQRCYIKMTDHAPLTLEQRAIGADRPTLTKVDLPITQHRARSELRVQGAAIAKLGWSDWSRIDFADIREFFRYRIQSETGHPLIDKVREWQAQIGELKGPGRAKKGRSQKADIPLNRKAYDALRSLTEKMRR